MNMFVRSFKGQESLSKAFWLVYVVTSLVLLIVISFIVRAAAPEASPFFKQNISLLFLFPYIIFSAFCVWRCGKNSTMLWSILTKVVVVLGVLYNLLIIVHMFQSLP